MKKSKSFRAVLLIGFCLFVTVAFAVQFPNIKTKAENFFQLNENDGFHQASVVLPTLSPSPTPELTHNLVAAYYDVQNFPTAKLLLNNKGLEPIQVSPTLYNLDGVSMSVPPVSVPANSHIFVNLSDWANIGGESFQKGSLKLFHTGKDLIIGSQIYLEESTNSLSFEERLVELGKFDSRRFEAIWAMPNNQAQVQIILSNTSDTTLSVNAKLSKKPHHTGETQTFLLQPHQTRVLDLRNDFTDGNQFANSDVVGITLAHTGDKSALKAHGQIKDAANGYSNIISFNNPNSGKSSELHGTGLHLGTIAGEELEPVVAVKNVGTARTDVTIKVPYTRTDGTTGTVNLNSINLKEGEMRLVNMNPVINRSRQEQIQIAGIELSHAAAPGSIIVQAQSLSESKNQVYRVPLADPLAQTSSTGGYPWRIEETSRTVSYIKNMTDLEQEYVAHLTWENDGMYMIGRKKLAPNKTIEIDVKKLRDEQIPDERGNLIPLTLNSGQIKWTLRHKYQTGNKKNDEFALIGRSEQIDTTNGVSSSYACQNCCFQQGSAYVQPDHEEFEVGETVQFEAIEFRYDCYGGGSFYNIDDADWSSNNTNIATVNSNGQVTIQGVGNAEIEAEWITPYAVENTNCGPGGPYLVKETDGIKTEKECEEPEPTNAAPCNTCTLSYRQVSPDADVDGIPKVQKIQYQEPGTSNYIDITNTLYVLKGTTVNFKAIPFPNNATFPSGQPTWSGTSGASGTGQTKSVTFNTISSSTTNYKTVIASNGTPITVNVVVYELTGTLNPQDYFYGRSIDRYGIAEKVNLGFLASPNVTINQMGGLSWRMIAGSGAVTQDSRNNFMYTAPNFSSNETLRLEISSGPSKGNGFTYAKTVITPSGAVARQTPGTGVGHEQGYCDVGFSLEPYLLPTDVSFSRLGFAEGTVLPTTANGYYAGLAGYPHPPSGPAIVSNCDIVLGCKADFQDMPAILQGNPPCTTGTFIWDIPWQYVIGATQFVNFSTARHHVYNTPPDRVNIEKAGVGPFSRAVSDPTTTVFP